MKGETWENKKGVDLNLKGLADLKGTVTGYFNHIWNQLSNELVFDRKDLVSLGRGPKNVFLGLSPKLWVGGGQES